MKAVIKFTAAALTVFALIWLTLIFVSAQELGELSELSESAGLTEQPQEIVTQSPPPVTEEPADTSTPRLMATSFTVENGFASPGSEVELTVVLKNTSSTKTIKNLKLSFAEESGELSPSGMGTRYVEEIPAGDKYTWTFGVTASYSCASGEHIAVVSAEYESDGGGSYTSSDTVRIPVRQTVSLLYDGAVLPAKVIAGDTVSININLMNTGKSTVSNVTLSFDIEGLHGSGTVFAGTITPGESKPVSANLNVDTELLGEVKGSMKIAYEDDFGEPHELSAELSSTVIEKVKTAQSTPAQQKKTNGLWWLFVLIGTLPGAALGAGIPAAVRSRRQRLIDEKTL